MLILGAISESIISVGIWIVSGIYKIAAVGFKVFLILSSGELVEDAVYDQIIKNFYIVLGIVMLFAVAFALLRGMVNPEDKKTGTEVIKKIIINLITSVILLTVISPIFKFGYDFQTAFITNNNTIGKFFGLGNVGESDDSPASYVRTIEQGSYQIVNGVYTAFFNVTNKECERILDEDNIDEGNINNLLYCQNEIVGDSDESFYETMGNVEGYGDFSLYIDFAGNVDEGELEFNFFLSLIAGCLLVYVSVSYCFDMALRLIKLVFYQIIAPIPIFLRVVPYGKLSKIFNQWIKITLTCYLEVFVRIFILYLCIYLSANMMRSTFLTESVYAFGTFVALLTKAFVLMGLIMFMRRAPKLFSEITGVDSKNMKLGIAEKLKDGGFFAASNAVGSLVSGRFNPLAAARGWRYGWNNANFQGIGNEGQRYNAYAEARRSGATRSQILSNWIRQRFGMESGADARTRRIENGNWEVANDSNANSEFTATSDTTVVDANGNERKYRNGDRVVVAPGETLAMNRSTKEAYEAENKQLDSEMASANEQLRIKDKQIASGSTRVSHNKALNDEAEKKITEDGSGVHVGDYMRARKVVNVGGQYMIENGYDANGEAITTDIAVGQQVNLAGFGNGTITKIDDETGRAWFMDVNGNERLAADVGHSDLTYRQFEEEVKRMDPSERDRIVLKDVFDDMKARYIDSEIALGTGKIAHDANAGFADMYNANRDAQGNVISSDGDYVYKYYDANHDTAEGRITVDKDAHGNFVVKDVRTDAQGNQVEDVLTDRMNMREVIEFIDKKVARTSNNILDLEKREISVREIDPRKARKENNESMIKNYDSQIAAAKSSPDQRALEAAKGYTAKYNGNQGKK